MVKNLWLLALLLTILLWIQGTLTVGSAETFSGLPVLPSNISVPQPSGKPGNLVVLDWAGFKSGVSYTYDDAQPSHIAHYEALQATDVRMTFYFSSNVNWVPNSDAVWAQAVKDGHEIGNHTVSHPYANLTGSCFGQPLDSMEAEIDECNKYIVERFGQSHVWTMAAPFGDMGWKEAAKAKFFLNRGVGGEPIAPNDKSDPFNLPCYMANAGEKAEKFNRLVDSARSNGRWIIFLYHTINPTQDNWYAPVEISEIIKHIDYTKAYGDVWIDTLANIGAYWMGQKIITSTVPTASGKDKTWKWTLPPNFPEGKYLRVKVDGGTLKQGGKTLQWDPKGYYEISLDAGELVLAP